MTATTLGSRLVRTKVRSGALVASRETTKLICGLNMAAAEEWLDWLEANGFNQRGLSYLPESGFVVWYI